MASDPQVRKRTADRRGWVTLIVLAVLTGGEFWISSVTNGSLVFLFILGLIKAGIILQYFMHVSSLWSQEAHG